MKAVKKIERMHPIEREQAILDLLKPRGFIAIHELEKRLEASSATLRRDLQRMAQDGRVSRVRGGVMRATGRKDTNSASARLAGATFHENIARHRRQKEIIGRAAADLCAPGSTIMINGGSTTLQICDHLEGKRLQVLTNSLHIVRALLNQPGTRVLVPGGSVLREQNIILAAAGDDTMPWFHAQKLFMGAAALGLQGVMQTDVVLVAAERRLIERAEELILLVDSSKFKDAGNVVCDLKEVDVVVTDSGIAKRDVAMLQRAAIKVIIAD